MPMQQGSQTSEISVAESNQFSILSEICHLHVPNPSFITFAKDSASWLPGTSTVSKHLETNLNSLLTK